MFEEINPSNLPIKFVFDYEGLNERDPFVRMLLELLQLLEREMLCISVIGAPGIISQRFE